MLFISSAGTPGMLARPCMFTDCPAAGVGRDAVDDAVVDRVLVEEEEETEEEEEGTVVVLVVEDGVESIPERDTDETPRVKTGVTIPTMESKTSVKIPTMESKTGVTIPTVQSKTSVTIPTM